MKNLAFMWVGILEVFSVTAIAGAPNSSFVFERHNSEFRVELTQVYAPEVTWGQVLQAHGNSERLQEVSDYFVRTERLDEGRMGDPFRLAMVAREYGFEKTTVARCQEARDAKSWERKCDIALDEADGGSWFRWGRPSSRCEQLEGQPIICKIVFEGSPKGFDFFVVRRSDAEFGVHLSGITLDDAARLGWFVTEPNGIRARNAYVRDPFRAAVQRFREIAADALRRNPQGNIRIEGGNTPDSVQLK